MKRHGRRPAHRYVPAAPVSASAGDKFRAPADRGAVRDLIAVHAAAEHRPLPELEQLGQRHGRDASRLDDLRDRLAGTEWFDDEEFAAYGLSDDAITTLRNWAQQWAGDLDERLARESDEYEDRPTRLCRRASR